VRRRLAVVALAGVAVLIALVPLGRWEHRRELRDTIRGMERVRAAVGTLDSKSLFGYRVLPIFDCLVYRRGPNPYALELCADGTGRVVEAIDRRGRTPRFYSLRAEPSASTVRVSAAEVKRLLRKMGALR
jgi:hypothetical protein